MKASTTSNEDSRRMLDLAERDGLITRPDDNEWMWEPTAAGLAELLGLLWTRYAQQDPVYIDEQKALVLSVGLHEAIIAGAAIPESERAEFCTTTARTWLQQLDEIP